MFSSEIFADPAPYDSGRLKYHFLIEAFSDKIIWNSLLLHQLPSLPSPFPLLQSLRPSPTTMIIAPLLLHCQQQHPKFYYHPTLIILTTTPIIANNTPSLLSLLPDTCLSPWPYFNFLPSTLHYLMLNYILSTCLELSVSFLLIKTSLKTRMNLQLNHQRLQQAYPMVGRNIYRPVVC